jgi:hypothetical protein
MIIVHIQVRVFYLPPFLLRFENIGVIWSMLLHSEETVQSVMASSSLAASSTITVQNNDYSTFPGQGILFPFYFVEI